MRFRIWSTQFGLRLRITPLLPLRTARSFPLYREFCLHAWRRAASWLDGCSRQGTRLHLKAWLLPSLPPPSIGFSDSAASYFPSRRLRIDPYSSDSSDFILSVKSCRISMNQRYLFYSAYFCRSIRFVRSKMLPTTKSPLRCIR